MSEKTHATTDGIGATLSISVPDLFSGVPIVGALSGFNGSVFAGYWNYGEVGSFVPMEEGFYVKWGTNNVGEEALKGYGTAGNPVGPQLNFDSSNIHKSLKYSIGFRA